jgi:hypothetical protein
MEKREPMTCGKSEAVVKGKKKKKKKKKKNLPLCSFASSLRIELDVSALDVSTRSDVAKACYDGLASQDVNVKSTTYRCKEADRLTAAKATWLKETLLKRAEAILEKALMVRVANETRLRLESGFACGTDGGVAMSRRATSQSGASRPT